MQVILCTAFTGYRADQVKGTRNPKYQWFSGCRMDLPIKPKIEEKKCQIGQKLFQTQYLCHW